MKDKQVQDGMKLLEFSQETERCADKAYDPPCCLHSFQFC